jgi:hypothetical protein
MNLEKKITQIYDLTFSVMSVNGMLDTLKMDSVIPGNEL